MILGSICVRGGSKGVPKKNIKILNGNPLLFYTVDCATHSMFLNDIVVSSDDDQMLAIAKNLGIKNTFKRPDELATDKASKWDVFIHLVEEYESKTGNIVEFLVDLDVTVPLRKPEHIDGAIAMMQNNKVDVVITGYEPERNPYFNMMEITEGNYAEIVKKSEKPIVCRQDAPLVYSLTPAVYVIRKQALYDFKHWSDAKCMIYEIPRKNAVDIDTDFDFELVEFLMQNKK
ncbi:N-acylneuraminate cytidylyltransferase/CMP-N,N'-diacetyllegionaminic acid synthase [Flavobacterium sp. CG_23.5]|uniref:acylneuraminate cytidylyltransferase family protein n=1 Tax=Flavobacterium sp. CG_23.5 TaxID=2760708 RepID=UPI001AE18E01|nr:acylneuraminate cytidylyltransferase family protein [Flavobacterium sp. CG_23.5]MBP2283036.1 N-acylneuraminate cytidylyltransferase/CMP-N,N'-diacetyllegionaminic acid synthase [Flavobacterium sp. CG_23.5]